MTLNEALRAIRDCGCPKTPTECGCWTTDDPDVYRLRGESADGVPDWWVYRQPVGWSLSREIGWYVQQGDAEDLHGLVRLASAMDAASRALDDALAKEGDA